MGKDASREPMLDMFIFETTQLLEQLEQLILSSEKASGFESSINEIFRIMHTIKGSSAMMLFDNISTLAHSIEDLFYYLREGRHSVIDYTRLSDIVLEGADFIKSEVSKIEKGKTADGDASAFIKVIEEYLSSLKLSDGESKSGKEKNKKKDDAEEDQQKYYISHGKTKAAEKKKNIYEAVIYFEDGCEMENIRAFTVVHGLKEIADVIGYTPENIIEDNKSAEIIREEGFRIVFATNLEMEKLRGFFMETIFLKEFTLNAKEEEEISAASTQQDNSAKGSEETAIEQKENEMAKDVSTIKQSVINVNVSKLDTLMDLVGELVISEAMVIQNPELNGLELDGFHKAASQLQKITGEIQDIVMSIRMVQLSVTFQKMNRLVRDMSKKLNKEVELKIIGEETEVDKNIIEHISDPLMHIIRNSIDHGIEGPEEREAKGKSKIGNITLEAKNTSGDVWIIIKDDGKGLDKEKILKKARENGLTDKDETELTDKEIYSFIFLPGFSTKDKVTEFSGRGVGMDVVMKNIQKIGGSVSVDSVLGAGTTVYIKIPLTLAIIDGMTIRVGESVYTIPTTSIKESFKVKEENVIVDPEGSEMIMIRGECYPIVKLYERFHAQTEVKKIHEGIVVMVEDEKKGSCLFADELIGQQQVVVKALPAYIKKINGVAGCTLLGNGEISLILDVAALLN